MGENTHNRTTGGEEKIRDGGTSSRGARSWDLASVVARRAIRKQHATTKTRSARSAARRDI